MGTRTVIESDFLASDVVVLAEPVIIQNRTADTDSRLPAPAALFIPQWGMDDLASVAELNTGERLEGAKVKANG